MNRQAPRRAPDQDQVLSQIARQAVFEIMSDPAFVLDGQGRVLELNRAARELLGAADFGSDGLVDPDRPASAPPLAGLVQDLNDLGETIEWSRNGALFRFQVKVLELSQEGAGSAGRLVILRPPGNGAGGSRTHYKDLFEKFRAIFEESLDVVLILDPESSQILQANPAASRVLGYGHEHLVGENFSMLFPADHGAARAVLRESLEANGWAFQAQPFRRADGSLRLMDLTATLIPWRDGQAVLATFRDVTERKLAEEALQQSEEHLRTIFAGAPLILFALDQEGRFTLLEGRGLDALKLRSNELLHRSVFDLADQIPQLATDVRRSLAGESFSSVLEVSDQVFEVQYTALKDPRGLGAGVIGVALDITGRIRTEQALQESEERFQNAFSHAAIGMALVSVDGRYLRVNPALCELLGYTEAELLRLDYRAITYPEDLNESIDHSRRLLAGEVESYHLEKRYVHQQGHPIWVQLSVSLIRDQNRRPQYYFVQAMDIGERKRTELLQSVSYHIAEAAVNAAGLAELCGRIREELGAILNARNFYIALYDEPAEALRFPYFMDETCPDEPLYDPLRSSIPGKGLAEYTIRSGESLLIAEMEIQALIDGGELEFEGAAPYSWLGTPLQSDGKTIGLIAVQSYSAATGYTERDLQLLQFASTQIGISIERKQAEQRLKKSEEKYRLVVENASEAIVVTQDGRVKFVNPEAVKLTGYSVAELTELEFNRLIHPDDQQLFDSRDGFTLIAGRHSDSHPIRCLDKFGGQKWLEIKAVRIQWEERPATLNFLIDITDRKSSEEAQRQYSEQLKSLQQLSLEVVAELDVEKLLHSIVTRAVGLLDGQGGGLYLYRAERDELEQTVVIGQDVSSTEDRIFRGRLLAGRIWESRAELIVDDYARWVGRESDSSSSSWRAVVGVPVRWREEFLGVLFVISDRVSAFTEPDANLLSLFANQAAIALVNARLFTAERRRRDEAETLRAVSNALASTLEQKQVLELILLQLADVIEYDSASVMLWEGDSLRVMAARGFEDDEAVLGQTFSTANGLLEAIQSRGTAVWLDDPASDPRFQGWGGTEHIKSWMGLPLLVHGKFIGYMTLDSYKENAYGEAQAALVQPFANQAAQAIDNARRFDWVQRQAVTDALTGLYNRRGLFELGNREFERARRFGRTMSAIMLDIDHFKQVNDRYGHIVGDQVLCELARRCSAVIRKVDFLGRYGGEEFAILLPETELETALRVAERLREQIADLPVETDRSVLSITISLGVTQLGPETVDLAGLLDAADAAMYLAKQAGRNCVRVLGNNAAPTNP